MKIVSRLLSFCVLVLPVAVFAQTMPPLNSNAWNFVFVQSFEPDASPANNNLSIRGYNHSLLFGQLLNTMTAGKTGSVRQVYALDPSSAPQNMATVQSIEPYAVLNNLGMLRKLVTSGDRSVYGSPAYIISNILANGKRGVYIMAMPAALINSTIESLTNPASSPGSIAPGNYNQYAVLTVEDGRTRVTRYDDNLKPGAAYPDLRLKPGKNYSCPQQAVKITAPRPKSSKYQFNAGQTVYFVRHVEAHPTSTFENGNFVCQGEWRAMGANEILLQKMGGAPKVVFTTNPADLIDCDQACSYIRPTLTISPFAIQHNKRLALAAFQWNDAPTLAAALFTQNTPYSNAEYNRASMLVAWEHVHIEQAVKYLFNTIYDNPAKAAKIPSWNFTDYDTIWKLETDEDGNITFSNTCEGIDSNTLPSTCPAFPVETYK